MARQDLYINSSASKEPRNQLTEAIPCSSFADSHLLGAKTYNPMFSEQRRLERYQVIYTWKIMEGLTPNCGVKWSQTTDRNGRLCKIPHLKGRASVQTKRSQSFQVSGPRLFNAMPKEIRNSKNCSLEDFKILLDTYLEKVPDEPKTQSLIPCATNLLSGRQTNSIIYQVARDRPTWANNL